VGGGSRKMLQRQRGSRVPGGPWYRTVPYGVGLVRVGDTVFLSRLSSVMVFYFRDRIPYQSSRMSLALAHRLRQGDPRAFGATNRGPSTRNDATGS
jgi:hypothetical protein